MADVKISGETWQFVVAALQATGQPWPPELATVDLEWLRAEYAEGRRTREAGRPFLQSRWRYADTQVRGILNGHFSAPTPPGWVYFVQAGDYAIKIGFSRTENAEKRISALQTGAPVKLQYLGARPGTLADEKALHRRFAADRLNGEWFRPTQAILDEISRSATVEAQQSDKITQVAPITSSTTGKAEEYPKITQPGQVPQSPQAPEKLPARQRAKLKNAPKSPSPQTSLLNIDLRDPYRSEKEELRRAGITSIEARTFLDIYTRWASDPKAPKRWIHSTADALNWFTTQILAHSDLLSNIDVVATLKSWGSWLDTMAQTPKGTGDGPTFPKNWQKNLHRWFSNENKFQIAAIHSRPVTSAAPARPRRGEYTSSTDPRLQPPATPGDYEDDF